MSRAMHYLKEFITEEVNEALPLHGSILKQGEVKKDKVKTVYIDLGNQVNVEQGTTFKVIELQNVAGREVHHEIGRVKVNEVLGDDISLCKVTRGSKEVKQALDNGTKLLIVSYE